MRLCIGFTGEWVFFFGVCLNGGLGAFGGQVVCHGFRPFCFTLLYFTVCDRRTPHLLSRTQVIEWNGTRYFNSLAGT